MIKRRNKVAEFVIPIFVILLGIGNYMRLTGTEDIRAIHIVTLIAIGMAIGVLLRNLFTYFGKERQDV